MYIGQLT